MNINPQSTLSIVRQLSDPSDSGTYYVQAVVRNSATGTTLETINLTDNTGQRFTGSYQTPADGSGTGLYIDITTTVYTDSGYTTESTNYGIDCQTYFVHQQWNHAFGIGAGGEVNYDKIRSIVNDEITNREQYVPPAQRDYTSDLAGLEERINQAISTAVANIQFPEQETVDLASAVEQVRDAIEQATISIIDTIDMKEVTPETDLTQVTQYLQTMQEIPQKLQEATQAVQGLQDYFGLKEAAEEFMGKLPKRAQEAQYATPQGPDNTLRARKLMGI